MFHEWQLLEGLEKPSVEQRHAATSSSICRSKVCCDQWSGLHYKTPWYFWAFQWTCNSSNLCVGALVVKRLSCCWTIRCSRHRLVPVDHTLVFVGKAPCWFFCPPYSSCAPTRTHPPVLSLANSILVCLGWLMGAPSRTFAASKRHASKKICPSWISRLKFWKRRSCRRGQIHLFLRDRSRKKTSVPNVGFVHVDTYFFFVFHMITFQISFFDLLPNLFACFLLCVYISKTWVIN